ncbi:shikimate dehydrogenase [Actinoallomurus oryzae]|uniref:shikimate dehydrogenase (NADP(+)) n=1 Tax=Actinoallomurus oryzae TaxID=502180 RepID=A0ABP8QNQ5_9ACTN
MIGVRGTTRVLGIIGDPLAHARAPEMVNAVIAERGADAVLVPMLVHVGELAPAVAGLRAIGSFGGAVVTMPHKQAIVPFVQRLERSAAETGAVNVIRREADGTLTGDMLDGGGFLAGLRSIGQDVVGRRVLLLGAGGAAIAIAVAVARAGADSITIVNRTHARAEDLAARVEALGVAVRVANDARGDHDVVINATSAGMRPDDPMPLDPAVLRPGMVVSDIIVGPRRTPLVEAAEARGCVVQNGDAMLAGQTQLMVDFLLGGSAAG